jgi:ketosteroid isomerase-like protein
MRNLAAALITALLTSIAMAQTPPDLAALQQQVYAAERAFARSMAERRHEDFVRHLSDHALFFDGPKALHGKAAVAAAWRPFYDGARAPFSWEPDLVEVLADGTLALSTGLVRDPAGKPVARFQSIWRQEAPGVWRVVFDRGGPLSDAERAGG